MYHKIFVTALLVANFCFLVRINSLKKSVFIEAVVSSIFEIKLFRVFELKTAVYLQQLASTNLERSWILKQKNCWYNLCVTTLHERVKVISQFPNNV